MLVSPEHKGGISITDAESVGLQDKVLFHGRIITEDHALQAYEEASRIRSEIFDAHDRGENVDEFLVYRGLFRRPDFRLLRLSRGPNVDGDEEILRSLRSRFGVDCTAIYLAADWLADAGNYSREFDDFRLLFTNESGSLPFHYDEGEDQNGEESIRTVLQLAGMKTVSFKPNNSSTVSSIVPVGNAYRLAIHQIEHSATYRGDCVALYMQGLVKTKMERIN